MNPFVTIIHVPDIRGLSGKNSHKKQKPAAFTVVQGSATF